MTVLAFQHCRDCPDREGCHELSQCAINAMARTERGRQRMALAHLDGLDEAEETLAALADGLAAGIKITVPEEPREDQKKLLATLGAKYEVALTESERRRLREVVDRERREQLNDPRVLKDVPVPLASERTTSDERSEMDTTCVIEGCERPASGGKGPLRYRCDEHVREEMARRQRVRHERAGTAVADPEPEPDPAPEPMAAASTNGSGPSSYADRARVVLEAAGRLDKAQVELEAARAEYDGAREALAE